MRKKRAKKEMIQRRNRRLKMIKHFIIYQATEQEMIEMIQLMRLRKNTLDLRKEAHKREQSI